MEGFNKTFLKNAKEFFTENPTGIQIYSFVKTYIVVFLGIYFYGVDTQGKEMFDAVFIAESARFALISVIRNIWKLATE